MAADGPKRAAEDSFSREVPIFTEIRKAAIAEYRCGSLRTAAGQAFIRIAEPCVHVLDGGVIVTTPQEASLGVVRKGIAMFQKVNVPILGIVENMSYFTTPTGERVEIFGHGGGQAEAARQKVSFLGEVPLFTEIREGGDRGVPVVVSAPTSRRAGVCQDR